MREDGKGWHCVGGGGASGREGGREEGRKGSKEVVYVSKVVRESCEGKKSRCISTTTPIFRFTTWVLVWYLCHAAVLAGMSLFGSLPKLVFPVIQPTSAWKGAGQARWSKTARFYTPACKVHTYVSVIFSRQRQANI